MTSISDGTTVLARSQRDTRRMNQFVSIAAAVAGLLFGLDIGVIAGALPLLPTTLSYPAGCRSGWSAA